MSGVHAYTTDRRWLASSHERTSAVPPSAHSSSRPAQPSCNWMSTYAFNAVE